MSVAGRLLRGTGSVVLIVGVPVAVFAGLFLAPQPTLTAVTLLLGWLLVAWRITARITFDAMLTLEAVAAVAIIVALLHVLMLRSSRRKSGWHRREWRWRSTLAAFPIVMLLFAAALATTGLTHEVIRLSSMRPTWFVGDRSPDFAVQEATEASQALRDEVAEHYWDLGAFPGQGDSRVGRRIVYPGARLFRAFTLQPNGRIVFEPDEGHLDGTMFELQAVAGEARHVQWACVHDLRPYRSDICPRLETLLARQRS